MRIHSDHSIDLTPGSITSHVYDDGSAYLDFGMVPYRTVTIWVGKGGADLGEEAQTLRKLAEVASELAAGLERRDGTVPS